MGWGSKAVMMAAALSLLSACSDEGTVRAMRVSKRVSPAAVPAPQYAAGSFDQNRAKGELSAAQQALAANDAASARAQVEAAINHWPADPEAWTVLGQACQSLGDVDCTKRAAFFKDKVEYVNPLPARVAVLGFQSLAEEPLGTVNSGVVYDKPLLDTAQRMWAFYNTQDPVVMERENPPPEPEKPWLEEHPYAGMAVVGGITAAVLTEAKTLGNR